MNKEQQNNIINHISELNGFEYNLHKASEELQELALVLTQKLLKPKKVNDQEIIDEIGDVIIRLKILKKIYPKDKIEERIIKKLTQYEKYIENKEYNRM